MSDKKVLLVTNDVTLHKSVGVVQGPFGELEQVESVTLRPGELFNVDDLSKDQKQQLENGTLYGVEEHTDSSAQKKLQEVQKLRDLLANSPDIAFSAVGFSGPDADDGSFSDHEVTDVERAENHAERAKAEAGESGGEDADSVTVVGEDQPNSPAKSGRKTRKVEGANAEEGGTLDKSDE
jgi:hypothetical protein